MGRPGQGGEHPPAVGEVADHGAHARSLATLASCRTSALSCPRRVADERHHAHVQQQGHPVDQREQQVFAADAGAGAVRERPVAVGDVGHGHGHQGGQQSSR